MFKQLWRYILALFAGSKEPRWERLDRLAETDPEKYQRELAKLSMKELNEYMDSVMTDVADRMQHGWNDLNPNVAEGVKGAHQMATAITLTLSPEQKRAFDDAANGVASYETDLNGNAIRIIEDAADAALYEGTACLQVSDGGEIKVLSRGEVQKPADPREAPTDYHWAPGQEHSEPLSPAKPAHRRKRPGVFERQAFNRKERRQAAAVSRREGRKTEGA